MKKIFIALLTLFLLTGCDNLAPIHPVQPKKNYSTHKTLKQFARKKTSHKNSYNTETTVSLDDFSNLNLNNREAISGDLWGNIRQGMKIQNYENRPEVQEQIRWFMHNQGYLQRTTERARPYLYTVYQEVTSRNLPTELVLLPINESAYYPFSRSSTGATGIWQLMPATANDWGLIHTSWYDGRRDIADSTNAALDYFTYLKNYFNDDWLLVIAAYNTGEGNIQRAIARNAAAGLPTNFWALRVSEETRSYVPRFLALAAIVQNPGRYGITLPAIDAKPVTAPVTLDHQIKLTDAARFAGLDVNQLKILNPGLVSNATDTSAENKLLLPTNTIEDFKAHVNSLAPTSNNDIVDTTSSPENASYYDVRPGDTLQKIADHFGITTEALRQANDDIYGNHVNPGTQLRIPNTDTTDTFKPNTQIDLNQTPLKLNTRAPSENHHNNKKIMTHKKPNSNHVLNNKIPKHKVVSHKKVKRNSH